MTEQTTPVPDEAIEKLNRAYLDIRKQMSKVIVGPDARDRPVADLAVQPGALPAGGVPGLAKTLMISTLAGAVDDLQPDPVHSRT
jgi:MoxR-like ATPase